LYADVHTFFRQFGADNRLTAYGSCIGGSDKRLKPEYRLPENQCRQTYAGLSCRNKSTLSFFSGMLKRGNLFLKRISVTSQVTEEITVQT
jgi:hypothetical protein